MGATAWIANVNIILAGEAGVPGMVGLSILAAGAAWSYLSSST